MPVKKTLTRKNSSSNKESKVDPTKADSLRSAPVVKKCQFCEAKKVPSYTDVMVLRKCMSDRAKIMPKQRTGACSKHQRAVSREIKYARHLSMLPFVNVV